MTMLASVYGNFWTWPLARGDEKASAAKRPITPSHCMRLKPSGLIPKRPEEWRQHRSAEFNAHSFIVKVWIEEEINQHGNPIWHGQITHVPGGEQRYLRNLSEIEGFVEPYLSAMGIQFGPRERIRKWLSFFRNNK